MFLFETPIKRKMVRNGLYAYVFKNGVISINGKQYVMYSLTEAIQKFRKDYPAYKYNN